MLHLDLQVLTTTKMCLRVTITFHTQRIRNYAKRAECVQQAKRYSRVTTHELLRTVLTHSPSAALRAQRPLSIRVCVANRACRIVSLSWYTLYSPLE